MSLSQRRPPPAHILPSPKPGPSPTRKPEPRPPCYPSGSLSVLSTIPFFPFRWIPLSAPLFRLAPTVTTAPPQTFPFFLFLILISPLGLVFVTPLFFFLLVVYFARAPPDRSRARSRSPRLFHVCLSLSRASCFCLFRGGLVCYRNLFFWLLRTLCLGSVLAHGGFPGPSCPPFPAPFSPASRSSYSDGFQGADQQD